ncbi:ADAM 17-like protease isoform X2 [Apostichopus japonicus]|uniref:ADAM 17-like protease isoform X2 n=1 Tax=Stichopus japonicus TaxID=307972 RepID=UPI003AB33348
MDRLPTFPKYICVLLCAILICVIQPIRTVEGALHHALHYYQPLRTSDIRHHVSKRSIVTSADSNKKQITVNLMDRQLTLDLSTRTSLFHDEFKVFSVDKSGKKKEHVINKRAFYTGRVNGVPDSSVTAHFDGEDLTAKIFTPEEEYRIEPSWRHISEPHDYTMIAYKSSHVKQNSSSVYCANGHYLPDGLNYKRFEDEPHQESSHDREKRQVPPQVNTCPLLLTADYRFYKMMGLSSMNISINYLISLVDRVNDIYKDTVWDVEYHGFGFEVKEILVHEVPTYEPGHYNEFSPEGVAWNVQDLLEAYSKVDHSAFCLAHLFTFQDFEKGVLGLAYIGTPRTNAVGGICTKKYPSPSGDQYLNTGLTTTLNWGRNVLTDEADLVTAHELGHNFGSEHDPGSDEDCSPSNAAGGKYLMYPASVTGDQKNNKEFSVCSKRLIMPVLRSKSPLCFTKVSGTSWCGNYRIDDGEACDAGYEGKKNNDPCCDSSCQLKPPAHCSDQNHPCCSNCRYATSTTICRQASDYDADCAQTAYCTGRSSECPASKPREDNSSCIDGGKCVGGVCLPFCESQHRGLLSCLCSGENACYRCCKESEDGECRPFLNGTTEEVISVPNGRPCTDGVCVEGECEIQTQDLIERFFDVFEKININILRRILKDNVVGATIIISLIFWVPCSCIVHHFDKKREAEAESIDSWLNFTNTQRILPQDAPRVRSLLHWWDFQENHENPGMMEDTL